MEADCHGLGQYAAASDKTVSARTREVLGRCRERGAALAIATARSELVCAPLSEALQADVVITSGGALAKAGDRVLYQVVIPPETADAVFRCCRELPSMGDLTADAESGYLTTSIPDQQFRYLDFSHAIATDFTEPFSCGLYKICVHLEREEDKTRLRQAFPQLSHHSFRKEAWHSIYHGDADKWTALQTVAAGLGVAVSEILAFGDDDNDVSMLKGCGTGVAMANGISAAKAAADHICGHCDADGVAVWLEQHMLMLA